MLEMQCSKSIKGQKNGTTSTKEEVPQLQEPCDSKLKNTLCGAH